MISFRKRKIYDPYFCSDDSIAEARKYFDEGWSFRVAFAKSGHSKSFCAFVHHINHPEIQKMREESKIRSKRVSIYENN